MAIVATPSDDFNDFDDLPPDDFPDADETPAPATIPAHPRTVEEISDPHYIARMYRISLGDHDDTPLIRAHRGDVLIWNQERGCYVASNTSDLDAQLNSFAKMIFDAAAYSYNQQHAPAILAGRMKARKPRQVTVSLIRNVVAALRAQTLLAADIEPPTWLGDDAPFPARECLAARNGVIHLPSLLNNDPNFFVEPTPRFFTMNALDYFFSLEAPRPDNWLHFLGELWPNNLGQIELLQEFMGYLLTPDTKFHKILLLCGPKRGGKGTIARIIRRMIGPSNCAGPTLASLGSNFGLQGLLGKSCAIVSDARLSGRSDSAIVVERLLSISGEDAIVVDRKHREPITVRLRTRIIMLTNELPRLNDASGALASRFLVLPLTESWLGREDHELETRLVAEIPSILLWAIEGWRRLRERGRFPACDFAAEYVEELQDLASPISAFVRETCVVGDAYSVDCSTLYAAWRNWCYIHGREHPGDERSFGRSLRAAIPALRKSQRRIDGERIRCYEGIRLA